MSSTASVDLLEVVRRVPQPVVQSSRANGMSRLMLRRTPPSRARVRVVEAQKAGAGKILRYPKVHTDGHRVPMCR